MTNAERTINTGIYINAPVDVARKALTDLEAYTAWEPFFVLDQRQGRRRLNHPRSFTLRCSSRLHRYEIFSGSMMPEILDQYGRVIEGNFVHMSEALKHHLEK